MALVTDAMEAAGWLKASTSLVDAGFALRTAPFDPRRHAGRQRVDHDQALRNGVTFMGCPLKDAVRMASETPAEILGVYEKERITPGADADLVVLGMEATIEETIVAGEPEYDRRGEDHVQ